MLSKVIVKEDSEVIATYEGHYKTMCNKYYEWIDCLNQNEKRLKSDFVVKWFDEQEKLVRYAIY